MPPYLVLLASAYSIKENFFMQLQNHQAPLRNVFVFQDASHPNYQGPLLFTFTSSDTHKKCFLQLWSAFLTFFSSNVRSKIKYCVLSLNKICLHSYFWSTSACSPSQFFLPTTPNKTNSDYSIGVFLLAICCADKPMTKITNQRKRGR